MTRIGIPAQGFTSWGGGIDLLRMLISSLHHTGEAIEFHLLCATLGPTPDARYLLRHPYKGLRGLLGRGGSAAAQIEAERGAELASTVEAALAVHRIHSGPAGLARAARRLGLDVLFPSISLLPREFEVPWVGYAYDFQHRYFPELFEPAERQRRDTHFEALGQQARVLIVNAQAVADDLARFHPASRARVVVLPFCPAPPPGWQGSNPDVPARHGIHGPYFVICNQFWQHKDHRTAFEAFAALAATHPTLQLVCTGETHDYRAPGYFDSLMQDLERRGLRGRVHTLGRIAKADQVALLDRALALVQPTRFEGAPGGGAVYDAAAIGQRCVVSDIPVNRELSLPGLRYFAAGDADSLATAMAEVIAEPAPPRPPPATLEAQGRERRIACGRVLLQTLSHARQP